MRNLKRALSLGLTATMISGLMVMGSSAASYADVTSEQNQEAIEVLKSVGIMTGDEKGNFNPEAKVTRNEMAVVMSNLMAYNVKTYANTSPFTDVPDWAEPYVAACYTNGITSGYDKVTYGGSDNVTTAQAALMVMKALGYFQFQSDFGADWQLSTVAQGNKIDLFEDVDAPVKEAINRNELAQLVLNALESGTVEADDNTIKVENGDTTVSAGKVKYNYITSTKDYAKAIKEVRSTSDTSDAGSYVVELGEKLYDGDLTKDRTGDDFGRPSNKWEYQAKEVGTYPDSADHTFTANVTSKALYNAIGKTAAENYDMNVYFNGEPVDKYGKGDLYKNKADDDSDFVAYADASDKAMTANGVITEVFVDGTDEVVTVAIMEQYAAEVLKVDAEDGTITLSGLSEGKVVDAKDEFEATEFAEDDIVIYTYANDKIQSVYAAEKIEGDVTSVRINTDANADGKNTDPGDGDRFTVGGTTYKYNKTMAKADKLGTDNVNNGVVAYLDAQGYVAYIDESAITYDYAYVLSMGNDQDKFDQDSHKGTTYYARLVLTDGTIVKVETDNKSSLAGHIVSYSKDKNDVYSLSSRSDKIAFATDLDVNNDKASFKANGKTYTANANTIFIVADSDPDSYDDYDFTVYTGVKNVPDIDGQGANTTATTDDTQAVVSVKEGTTNLAKVVYIEDADVSGAGQVIFAKANEKPKYTKDQDGKIFEIDVIIDGEAKTIEVKEGSTAARRLITDIDKTHALKLSDTQYLVALESITENADGLVTSVRLYDTNALVEEAAKRDADGIIYGTGMDKSKDDVVTLKKVNGTTDSRTYTWADGVVVAQYDDKSNSGEFESSKMSSIKKDDNDKYLAVMDDGVITGICTVYMADNDPSTPVGPDNSVVTNGDVTLNAVDADAKAMSVRMTADGKVTYSFKYEPAARAAAATVDYVETVLVNGKRDSSRTIQDAAVNADGYVDGSVNVNINKGDKVEIQISNVEASVPAMPDVSLDVSAVIANIMSAKYDQANGKVTVVAKTTDQPAGSKIDISYTLVDDRGNVTNGKAEDVVVSKAKTATFEITPKVSNNTTKLSITNVTVPAKTEAKWDVEYTAAEGITVDTEASTKTVKHATNQEIKLVVNAPENAAEVTVKYTVKIGSGKVGSVQTANDVAVTGGKAEVTISSQDCSNCDGAVVVNVTEVTSSKTSVAVNYTDNENLMDTSKANQTTVISGESKTIDFYVKVPTGASKMTVTYSVDGSTKTDTNITNDGKVQVTAATYAKNVAIKVLNVEVTEYALKAAGNKDVTITTSSLAKGGAAVEATVNVADHASHSTDKLKITYTVTNGTSDKKLENGKYTAVGAAVISSASEKVALGKITPDGKGEVTINIESVEFTK